MSEKARDLLFSSQQLTYLYAFGGKHTLLGDTMVLGSDWARVQMPNLGTPCMALPKRCHSTWPNTLLLGEWATLFSMPRAAGWVCVQRLAQPLHSWAGWAAGFPRASVLKRSLKQGCLLLSDREILFTFIAIHSLSWGVLSAWSPKMHGAVPHLLSPCALALTCHWSGMSLCHIMLSSWWQEG